MEIKKPKTKLSAQLRGIRCVRATMVLWLHCAANQGFVWRTKDTGTRFSILELEVMSSYPQLVPILHSGTFHQKKALLLTHFYCKAKSYLFLEFMVLWEESVFFDFSPSLGQERLGVRRIQLLQPSSCDSVLPCTCQFLLVSQVM